MNDTTKKVEKLKVHDTIVVVQNGKRIIGIITKIIGDVIHFKDK